MTVWVGLLRGINVGGHTRVEMPRLREVAAAAGATDVSTYINSGNLVYRAPHDLASGLEAAIAAAFGFAVPVLTRPLAAIDALAAAIPADWSNDAEQRTDVWFLWPELDAAELAGSLQVKAELETVLTLDGAIVWNLPRAHVGRSRVARIVGTSAYRQLTIRNVNTVRKLHGLMTVLADSAGEAA